MKDQAQMITITPAHSTATLERILELQARNLASRVSKAEATEQGFVTVEHDLMMLQKICGPYQHIVALDDGVLVGYALVMLKEYGGAIPVLVPMFQMLDQRSIGTKPLSRTSYFVIGQVCIDKPYRGRGIFQDLYGELRKRMSGSFEVALTEVATRNARSLGAHAKVGFQKLMQYVSPDNESWEIIYWALR
jgi:hypothetical protein